MSNARLNAINAMTELLILITHEVLRIARPTRRNEYVGRKSAEYEHLRYFERVKRYADFEETALQESISATRLLNFLERQPNYEEFALPIRLTKKVKSFDGLLLSYPDEVINRARKLREEIVSTFQRAI